MKQRSKVRQNVAAASIQTGSHFSLDPLPRAGVILFVVAACLVCLGYTLYTDQTWEDSLITLRHSENLLKGEGLTFNPGERVHGFTSPINVLLLALCQFLTGQSSYVATFWLYRVFSIAAFAASGVLLLKAVHETPPRWFAATWFLGVVYLFDVKNVAFCVNGMETAFMLVFVAWAVYLMSRFQSNRWLWRGLCWGGLMWSRPDGCVYIGAFSLAELVFLSTSRRATLRSLVKSAAVCLIVYGPWVAWAWLYYGSPIPHTIIAKANIEQGPLVQLLATMDRFLTALISIAAQAFRPIYYGESVDWLGIDGLGRVLNGLTKLIGVVALLYFIYPTHDRFGRAMSLSFAIICSYFTYMSTVYPWYFPPAMLLGLTAFMRAGSTFALAIGESTTDGSQWQRVVVLTTFAIIAIGAILLFGPASLEQRIHQTDIEMGNRAAIGKWLKENGKPSDNVYLEPVGYIGYFSGMRVNDYPGLVSPEVVRLRRQLPPNKLSVDIGGLLIIPELKPDWVVLRFEEVNMMTQLPMFEAFKKDYTAIREFNVNEKLSQHGYIPGVSGMRFDAGFVVFRRNPTPPSPTGI
jgi:hypothetical protein